MDHLMLLKKSNPIIMPMTKNYKKKLISRCMGIDQMMMNNIKIEEIKEMEREQIREGIDEFGILYSELGDSNRSEGSNGSFAFPVLNWEWMGSPVKMPKSEDICQKKQKIRFIPFQCCRF
ncbi:Protein BREAKING OF ASYMMETRY IN THE STOMATAL LINEAGE [Arachis hypogaea]|nr:Protein BREAKING OF ASYMMETRY IN THE STOMATAL LINEAGE [Arachis hypogaea]